MPVFVVASNSKCNVTWDNFKKRAEERRAILENARTMNVKRLQQDVDRIARRETEFAKQVIEEIVPVKIVWDEEGWNRLSALLPFRVVPTKAATPVVVEEKQKPVDPPAEPEAQSPAI